MSSTKADREVSGWQAIIPTCAMASTQPWNSKRASMVAPRRLSGFRRQSAFGALLLFAVTLIAASTAALKASNPVALCESQLTVLPYRPRITNHRPPST